MKKTFTSIVVLFFVLFLSEALFAQQADSTAGFIIRHESSLLKEMKSPHNGKGNVKGCDFYGADASLNFVLRERRIQNGGSLGKHQQKKDEIYFVVSGEGTILLNETPFNVRPGDAILTRKGSTHELLQTSKEDLVILVIFSN